MTTTEPSYKSARDVAYFRQRFKNRVFASLIEFVSRESAGQKLTKRDLAERAAKDPAQISRIMSSPTNLTLETISDILLALGAEADPFPIRKFSDYETKPNFTAPLYARLVGAEGGEKAQSAALPPMAPAKEVGRAIGSARALSLQNALGDRPLDQRALS